MKPTADIPVLSMATFPPLAWFYSVLQSPVFYVEACESWQKQSYRNRYLISTANGVQSLVVPVEHQSGYRNNIQTIAISYHNNWNRLHSKAIASAYRNTPFYEHYWPFFEVFFVKKWEHLYVWNTEIVTTCLKLLKYVGERRETENYLVDYPSGYADFRSLIHPKKEDRVVPFEPQYPQAFAERHGFIPNLSILDLLFNLGPDAGEWFARSI